MKIFCSTCDTISEKFCNICKKRFCNDCFSDDLKNHIDTETLELQKDESELVILDADDLEKLGYNRNMKIDV